MIEIAQHERRASDAERLIGRRDEVDADVDDINGAEPEPFIELALVAELGSRKHLMSNLPLVRFLISLAAHSASVW